ncbi:YdiU family protein [Weeksellaceae bacterium KMM 9713]|uniref:Protein nucleotidyltransferase YdiU n=1 Tax=Profundicola chukchiensis TaxID=2961959 RepID=A0A9X4MZ99_9FLAO|nr:YdiU family protein [Profundicola chukchiensis]MDG4946774.1 YdiU family protein [Profundicola chukchiensis]
MKLNHFKYPFVEKFPGDESWNPMQRQTPGVLYALVHPIGFPKAELIASNDELLENLGFKLPLSQKDIDVLNSNVDEDFLTYATAYAGHQFGNWAGQLGDGRAIYFGELKDKDNKAWELQWKGAGATPYSRHADGRAVLRSSIREYLMSEAMFHLNIPTTRALSLSLSGEKVMRDILYNGNAAYEPGAVMVRAAESFLRFGHFELLSARDNIEELKNLADWSIERYFPEIKSEGKEKYIEFFNEVKNLSIKMIVEWYRVGFVHGVMNTDNMSILGLSIDYGPYAMLEEYDLKFTSNTTDLPGRRYAFGQQANIALWNLSAFGNALYPLIEDIEPLQEVLESFEDQFWKAFDTMMGEKLGLDKLRETDKVFLHSWQKLMIDLKPDYTLFFVELMKLYNEESELDAKKFCYEEISQEQQERLEDFVELYKMRIASNEISKAESLEKMKRSNPQFILRNYQLFEAIEAAEQGDYTMFNKLNEALKTPYENRFPELQAKRPSWADNQPGCSMLSCSS